MAKRLSGELKEVEAKLRELVDSLNEKGMEEVRHAGIAGVMIIASDLIGETRKFIEKGGDEKGAVPSLIVAETLLSLLLVALADYREYLGGKN